MERHFAARRWSNAWRNGIYPFHHFHSIAHEVLGIATGEVRVMFGGSAGQELMVQAGDVVVIPAGVAHRNVRPRRIHRGAASGCCRTGTGQRPSAWAESRRLPALAVVAAADDGPDDASVVSA